jgi:glycerol-3-phosphate dehydrogenase
MSNLNLSWSNQHFDVVVIGGGVVGAALLRRFTLEGAKALLLEKAPDILDGASKGNSAILHTGFDAPTDSVEHWCIQQGRKEFLDIHEALGLPLVKTGALVVAWSKEEQQRLPSLLEKAHANGVDDARMLSSAEIQQREPELAPGVTGGFEVPQEYIIDPWTTPYAYLLQALCNGATVARNSEVLEGSFDGAQWHLKTTTGQCTADVVINAAGLYGDTLEQRLIGRSAFSIRPRKGQFVVYDKAASALLSSILLPVPTETTKGIVLTRTVFGNLLVGPTAEEQDSREDWSTDSQTLEMLHATAVRMLPALADIPFTATYAGVRPATEEKEYRIRALAEQRYVAVGGIRSTGLSSALGIAQYVFDLYQREIGAAHTAIAEPAIPSDIPQISEYGPRLWRAPNNGGIVCHCELVTQADIDRALCGPLPAKTLAGLKRRTRATMGRCQGFYCTARLAALSEQHLEEPIAEHYE